MKICILTVHDCENCGSFLQAYALRKCLEKMGHEVYYLKREKHDSESLLLEIAKRVARGRFKDIRYILARSNAFSKIAKTLPVKPLSVLKYGEMDLFVLGSDTIWNMESPGFRKNIDRYTGKLNEGAAFITYAASCANTTAETVRQYGIDFSNLLKAKAISVRDESTAKLIEDLIGRKTDLVCDPTLLIHREDYDTFQCAKALTDKYLLIYCFGAVGQKNIDEIREFAKSRNLKIVNIGAYQNWADVCLPATPDIFVSYYRDAEYVVTNTFHGTIFSTIFGKDFVVITDKKRKIADYLAQIQMEDRMLGDDDSLKSVLERPLENDQLTNAIEMLRHESLMFLEGAID